MMRVTIAGLLLMLTCAATPKLSAQENDGWFSLFNGKDFTGWKISENPDTFSVKDGIMVVNGPRAHAYYAGEVGGADFRNFELKCEIMTKPNANSGVFFHTRYQEEGWPEKGYEAQVNQSHPDPRKTGGLWGVKDVMDKSPVKDNEWFTQTVKVEGKRITISVNGKVTCDFTQEEDYTPPADRPGRVLSHGTIAIQGHDPGSEVHYRKIMIKPLD